MRRVHAIFGGIRRRPGIVAICALGVAWGLVMHSMGWAQTAYYAQTRALNSAGATIDQWHWETKDKAYVDGHFYSVKPPGVLSLALPAYAALDATGAQAVADDAAANAREAGARRWAPSAKPPIENYGYDYARAERTQRAVERGAPMVWALSLIAAVIPAIALLLLVRWAGDRVAPGYGTAAAVTLGAATMILPFASQLFSHAAAAALGFAAFALAWRERDSASGEATPRPLLLAAAGLAAGLAVTFEYPLTLAGTIVGVYVVSRGPIVRRGLAYTGGVALGVAPLLAYNALAYGSPLHVSYESAVATQGLSGHAVLGLNGDGLFGVTVPSPAKLVDLLIGNRGILTTTPVVAMGLVGAYLIGREGRRAEALVIAGITAAYVAYNAGYWLPFGGGSPGPRFLIPTLPFLALGLAAAYRRLPAMTLALAIPSAVFMIAATLTFPLLGDSGTGIWAQLIAEADFEHTVLTAIGLGNGWLAIVPVLGALAVAVAVALAATPRTTIGRLWPAAVVIVGWAALSAIGPELAGDAKTPIAGGEPTLALIGAGALAALAALAAARYLPREARSSSSSRNRARRPGPFPVEPVLEESSR